MPNPFLSITLLLPLLLTHVMSQQQQLYGQERAVLLRLKQHFQNQPPLAQWTPSTSSHCSWSGVNCTANSVTGINFAHMQISGTFPPFICDLNNLTDLNFGNNSIIGTFPISLYNCSKLQRLDLSQNKFVGLIPHDIDTLSQLSFLSLHDNNFTGDIPPAIGKLQGLTSLQLYQNNFNGTFPVEISNLSNLEDLLLAYNNFFPSQFPSNFTQLKKVKQLWFGQSNLIGEIPEAIGEMAALELLDLSENNLTGKIPASLFTLKNVSYLYAYKNDLSGEIPPVGEASNLIEIDLSDNNITGRIPNDIGKLEKLSVLSLFWNQLSGEIPASIGRLPQLTIFKVFGNNLSGTLPPDLGLHSQLEQIQVSSNRLTGKLPEFLCNGGKFVGVTANDNQLTGELPKSLGNCTTLMIVSVLRNSLSGTIPAGMWTASDLQFVMLSDNLLTGTLPNEVSRNLSRLEISNNKLSGELPSGDSWRNLVFFNASNNSFSGTIPRELTALPLLTTLLLDRNQLSGSLPSDIISWKSLNTLNFSQNQLSGQIPDELATLPNLNQLDLSENQLSGEIPPQLGSLKLNFLNLSSNRLTGQIPSQLEITPYTSSFLDNPGLCTTSSRLSVQACNPRPEKSKKSSTRLISLMAIGLAAAFVLALLVSFLVTKVYLKKKKQSSTWKFSSFHKLDFDEFDILSGLTDSNLIGSGGSGKVYRVLTKRSGVIVAVKRIWNDRKLDKKLEKEFAAEVEILSTIRHLNIVKMLCCISNDDSKLLVYEYMEKRSLDKWLHTKKGSSNVSGSVCHAELDWPTRFKIAVGAAQGLSYMHHDCTPPIVHRDVKSSNILLDSTFNAKVADFGLARLLNNTGEATVSVVAGSFGYIAPEYAQTSRVSEKIDVYSFGVILLELTTGKEANFGDENSCLADWALRHMCQGGLIIDALDKEIIEPSYLDEMITVFKLGVRCTCKMPANRPSMREVLQILVPSLDYGLSKTGKVYEATPLLKNSKREQLSGSDDNV